MKQPNPLPRATLLDVARESGFSKSVVSRALLDQPGVRASTAATIREVAKRLRYSPNPSARALVGARTTTIGLVLRQPSLTFYAALADALHLNAENANYKVISVSHGQGPSRYDDAMYYLLQLQVDGLIVSSSVINPATILEVSQTVPTIAVGRGLLDGDSIDSVALAPDASKALVDAFVQRGHQHLGLLHYPRDSSPTHFERYEFIVGYIRSLGLQLTREQIDGPDPSSAFEKLITSGPSVALCATDPTALALLGHMQARGMRAPEDLAVAGFDGLGPFADPYLGLTTYRVPVEDMARHCMELLLNRMQSNDARIQRTSLYGDVIQGTTGGI